MLDPLLLLSKIRCSSGLSLLLPCFHFTTPNLRHSTCHLYVEIPSCHQSSELQTHLAPCLLLAWTTSASDSHVQTQGHYHPLLPNLLLLCSLSWGMVPLSCETRSLAMSLTPPFCSLHSLSPHQQSPQSCPFNFLNISWNHLFPSIFPASGLI